MLADAVIAGLLATVLLPSLAGAATCNLRKIAELPVTLYGARERHPVVGATIDGIGANLIFDTGGASNTLSQGALARLRLRATDPPPGYQVRSMGQIVHVQMAKADRVTFSNIEMRSADFDVVSGSFGQGIDGFLGEAAFAKFDIEVDLADRVIRLFMPEGCDGQSLAYWADPQDVSVIELEPFPKAVRPFGWIKINGVPLRALFDTGAPDTDLTSEAAKRAGVTPGSEGVQEAGTTGGLGPGGLRNWRGQFKSLTIGKENIANLRLNFTEKPNASADLIIGADYFKTHRVFISKS